MELRKSILSAILLAIGFVLHQVVPAFGMVTFDIQLAMLFVIIALNMNIKSTLVVSAASGIITAVTTKFPGGQLPNIIDKMITGLLVYFLLMALSKLMSKQIAIAVTGLVGTIVSGSIFLTSAMLIVGLPAPFTILFTTVIIPTALANTIIAPFLFYLVGVSKKATKLEF